MYILDFINDLRLIDIIILILVIFIFIFLLVLTSSLLKKNKLLREELCKKNKDSELDKDITLEKIEDELNDSPIKNNSNDIDEVIQREEENIDEILKDLPELTETGPYKKNILRELNTSGQTSPVNIGKSTVDVPKVKVTSYAKPKEQVAVNKLEKKSMTDVDNQTFIEEISKRMEQELEPQTIELTDYEKKQEEEAVISYQELMKVKDKIYRISDDEEIETFIDELKELRTNLNE